MSNNTHTLKEAIHELLKAYRLDGRLNEVKLINSWEKVTGKITSKHTTNIYIKEQTLFVQLNSAALKHELSMAKSKIVDSLNTEVGADVIKDIVFK